MGFLESFGIGFLILMLIALVVSSVGFYKYVYFISLGYGFSIAAMGVTLFVMYREVIGWGTLAMCVLFLIYGCRLGGYLLIREIKSASYRSTMKKEIKDGSSMKFIAKVSIWVSCAFLYVLQVSPLLFRLMNAEKLLANNTEALVGGTDIVTIVGAIIMALGIILESAADFQKSRAKKKNPSRFCDTGLYKIVRCPNYLGEVLFWTGVFVSGINIYANAWQWIAAAIGYICIVYIMFGGARRLELRQNRNYGDDPEYQAYVKKTPILIPLIPLYSVAKHKWLVG
ncbi:MAG: DUF1295 domain-containing protein [Lachnospiraceae bacterium]|nr:DUF1295 domain-containing protein [Lachnospiraceae bacterium]